MAQAGDGDDKGLYSELIGVAVNRTGDGNCVSWPLALSQ